MTTPYFLKIQKWWRGVRVRILVRRWLLLRSIRGFLVWNPSPSAFVENTPVN